MLFFFENMSAKKYNFTLIHVYIYAYVEGQKKKKPYASTVSLLCILNQRIKKEFYLYYL